MKKIIHLSDLHFGSEKQEIISTLITDIQQLNPDLIVISGDFTQRALTRQYKIAKEFLNSLGNKNIICVPGNHDITLYNPVRRFFNTYERYKTYISSDLNPLYCDNELAVLGINSATPYRPKGGIVTHRQLAYIRKFFHQQSAERIKILVMHHNLLHSERHRIIQNSERIVNLLMECKVNLVLSGHLHYAYIEKIEKKRFHHLMYVITAGTTTSTRLWGRERNSFNLIEIDKDKFKLSLRLFENGKFIPDKEDIYPLFK